MLTASASAPNTRQSDARSAPTPSNWFGVKGGMIAARDAVQQGNLEHAAQILVEMLEFAPSETAGWKLLAHIQRQLGHIEAGIESATRALKLQNAENQQQSPTSLTLAKLLWQQGEQKQAIEMLELLIIRQPEDNALIQIQKGWKLECKA